jgi:hypothetical protein
VRLPLLDGPFALLDVPFVPLDEPSRHR